MNDMTVSHMDTTQQKTNVTHTTRSFHSLDVTQTANFFLITTLHYYSKFKSIHFHYTIIIWTLI